MTVPGLVSILRHARSGDPFHGPSLDALLGDVTPDEAAAHPIRGRHSILELVLHLAAWADEVAARVEGRAPGMPEAGDWPDASGVTWADAKARLVGAHDRLLEAVRRFPEERLTVLVGGPERDAAFGTGVTHEREIAGVAEHDAYHGGQVALLKRALRA